MAKNDLEIDLKLNTYKPLVRVLQFAYLVQKLLVPSHISPVRTKDYNEKKNVILSLVLETVSTEGSV